jgi:hypothetical protein
MFDNTTAGAALGNALTLARPLQHQHDVKQQKAKSK